MTTAWVWFVRGRVDRSWRANPAGCLFAGLAIPVIVWLLACVARAQPVGVRSVGVALMGLLLGGVAICLVFWLIRWTVTPAALTVVGP